MSNPTADITLPGPARETRSGLGGFHAVYVRFFPAVLAFILLGSYYVDVYFVHFFYREIAIALVLALLLFHLVFAPSDILTNLRIAVLPLLAILLAMYVWAMQFKAHTGAPFFPSFAA